MSKAIKQRLILLVVGLLLILLGVRSVALKSVGRSTQAKVIEVKQVVDSSSSQMDHNYSIKYQFSVDGKTYTGSSTRNKVYNITALPPTGGMMPILYLPTLPQINGDTHEGPLRGLAFGGLGVVLLVAGCWPKKTSPAIEQEPAS